jgi:hypothetical protein
MRDTVERISKCFGPVPRELAYEAANEIELLHAELAAVKAELASAIQFHTDEYKNRVELEFELAATTSKLTGLISWAHRTLDITCPQGTCFHCDMKRQELENNQNTEPTQGEGE